MSGFATARQKMVDGQMRPSDVTDIRILDAMLAVPREAFVPDNKQALAYLDLDLDVSEGGAPKRFLIQPAVLAKMLQAAEIKESDRLARRFRSPDAVRCRCPGTARHGTRSGLRFLAFQPSPCPIFAGGSRLNPLRNQKCGPFAPRPEFRRRLLAG